MRVDRGRVRQSETTNPAARELQAALAEALACLEQPRMSDNSVHRARKALKKARAALRLLRAVLDRPAFRAENAALRDAGRYLAPLRDSTSALDTLEELRRRHPGKLRQMGLSGLTRSLRAERERAWDEMLGSRVALEKCARLLEHCLARAEKPDFSRAASSRLDDGLERIYRKGRKAFAEAENAGTTEALHEWRKQVKYLVNALQALYGAAPAKTSKVAKRAEKLAERLGDEHDLCALSRRSAAPRALQPVIERRRAKLQKRSFALGAKLYRKKPKRFVERLPAPTSFS